MQYIKHFVRFLYALFAIENTSPYLPHQRYDVDFKFIIKKYGKNMSSPSQATCSQIADQSTLG